MDKLKGNSFLNKNMHANRSLLLTPWWYIWLKYGKFLGIFEIFLEGNFQLKLDWNLSVNEIYRKYSSFANSIDFNLQNSALWIRDHAYLMSQTGGFVTQNLH